MGHYKNFDMTTYFVAQGTKSTTKEKLEREIEWFEKYLKLDKVYLEAFRGDSFASEEQVRMVKETFEEHGIRVEGGITTCIPTPEGDKPKQRMFDTFCYNDPKMLETLKKASALNGKLFDSFIIDDFYFTNCTCEACRREHDSFNKTHGITDGSWQEYRVHKMYEVSKEYMIAPAKAVNLDCKVIIKYPNWMEAYQETGYDPLSEKDIFDGIYTGTETRDPRHQDQHLPRYLSYSLMRYMEDMSPNRNGGGWFDPFDCQVLDYYLEQAYLTAFSKPKELMAFCFQALVDSLQIPPLGFMLDKLDNLLDHLGTPIGIPCYIPNASQGEDNIYDYLGMNGFPVLPTPFFPENAKTIMFTASSTYDDDVLSKLKTFVANGGKAIVTNGFVKKLLGHGIEDVTSIRDGGRRVSTNEFLQENLSGSYGLQSLSGPCEIEFPILEFRNNSTWGAPVKAQKFEETFTILARDTYGDGQMMTMVLPDVYSSISRLPGQVISKWRKEFALNGIWLEGEGGTGLFAYDNDTIVLYKYVTGNASACDMDIHIKGASAIKPIAVNAPDPFTGLAEGECIKPLYVTADGEAVFRVNCKVGDFKGFKIVSSL